MQVTTVKKVRATSFRLATVSRRAVLAALVLVVLASVVPAQLMAQDAIAVLNQPLVPNAVAPGGPGFNLTVYGTGFASGAVLNWNGSPRVTTVTNATKLSAAILATDIATAKTASITVTNVGGIPSNPVLFEVAKSGTAVFMSRNDLNVNTSATAVASGDFRGIGKTDLAVANSANSIDILLGNGDGTFQTAVNYPLASGFPTAIVAADVNGDGKLDLVVLLAHIKMVGVLLGNGDGTFTVGKNFATGNNPVSLTVADVNGDGKLDALVANKNDNTVSVLLGNGNGTFQTKQDYGTGVKPDSVTVGDFNADGLLDLAVANNTDNTVSVLLGAGSGTFPTHVDYATGVLPVWVVTADFNGDGKLDLAVSTTAGTISILLGVGDGTFGAHTDYKVNTNPQMMVAADFNGDGKTDLANVNFTNSSVSLLLGVGDGTFKSEAVYPTNTNPGFLALGDFNSDGRIDLAVVDTGVGKLSILSQTPLFVSPSLISFPKQLGGFPTSASTVTLRNTSTAPIAIGTPSLQGPNAADFSETDTCTGISLGAGQTCTFSIVFNPQDLGNRTAQIIIPEGVGNSSVGIALYGVGQLLVAIERNPHAFPTTLLGTSSAPYVANFKNYTNLPITVNVMELIGLDPQDYSFNFNVANPCPGASGFVAPPLSICYVNVVFTPTVKGSRTAGLTVYGHFSPGNGQQTILLSGLATGVSVKPAALTFPATTVGTSSTAKTVTVKNAYTTPLNVSVVFQAGNSKDFSETDNCKPTIAAGATCFVNVTFTPLATGTRTSALYIGDNDPTGPQIVTVTGTGQ
jgi:FG-GAP-like repeat/Abnormal spindle-like microcephaly-assoc'd, ASPM-SPD-2-Hydin/FG-GAP repeat